MLRLSGCMAWVLVVSGWFVSPALSAEGDGPAKVALLAGVNRYRNRILVDRPLQYAERDVEELAKELRTQGFTVRLLKGSAAGRNQATKANIEAALADVLKGRSAKDIVLLGFAGHGSQLPLRDVDGRIQKDSEGNTLEDAFYCPVDATVGEGESMLSLTRMMQTLNRKGGVNLLLVDACRDNPDPGRGTRSITGNELNGRLPANTAIVFSCAAGQQAFETDKAGGGHGVFFHHVLEGLRGKAASEQGTVTWNSLVNYVQTEVDRQAKVWLPNELTKRAERLKSDPLDTDLQTPHELKNLVKVPVLATVSRPPDAPRNGALEAGTKAGQEWDGNSLKMAFRWCQDDSFVMGSPTTETGRDDDEGQNEVRLAGFWMAKHEVTRPQWAAVMGLPAATGTLPVDSVGFEDARQFCRQWSESERKAGRLPAGQEIRLPTEAEWEYACRAGTKTAYAFGATLERTVARFSTGGIPKSEDEGPVAVGTFRANAWGLADMHGNLWEWCQGEPGAVQPIRGGSWDSAAIACRSASRSFAPASRKAKNIGFRPMIARVKDGG